MTRNMACSLTLGALALLVPTTGSAQTFVDVGVWTPGGGGRVVVGGAPVYGVPVYGAPVYGAPVYGVPVYRRPIYRPVYVAPPRSTSFSPTTVTIAASTAAGPRRATHRMARTARTKPIGTTGALATTTAPRYVSRDYRRRR